jgi:AraC-like DNA-binding protein
MTGETTWSPLPSVAGFAARRALDDAAAGERKTAKGTLRAAVEKEAERLLSHGKANVEAVAKALALSARTLSRRLVDEGATFGEVVDQLRRSLALQYLKEPGLSLSQITWLLGYEGSTSFNHARADRARP